ncbi:MAG: ABC transporter permease [Deltaproteobacteria bacterium]|nr:ABC transporter permease [Deltaproteobacteria bacterium]
MIRNLEELWRYRSLLWALVCRHLHARYRGSVFGFVWSFLNPLCLIAVYSLVFRYYIRFDHVEHYSLFVFTGLLPWLWFSTGLIEATGAISSGGNLITKAMFPPHILPMVSVLTNLANFLFAVPLLIGFMLLTDMPLQISLTALPIVIALELLFLAGLGLALSALNVYFRDIQHLLGNFLTFWFFLSPVIYPATSIPEKLRFTLFLNPIALFTQMYHGMFLDGRFPELLPLVLVGAISLLTFVIGNWVFNRYREEFAELI